MADGAEVVYPQSSGQLHSFSSGSQSPLPQGRQVPNSGSAQLGGLLLVRTLQLLERPSQQSIRGSYDPMTPQSPAGSDDKPKHTSSPAQFTTTSQRPGQSSVEKLLHGFWMQVQPSPTQVWLQSGPQIPDSRYSRAQGSAGRLPLPAAAEPPEDDPEDP